MTRTTSSTTTILVALFLIALQAGCNTTAGAGKDVSAVGDAVTGSAEENKGY
jgi:predicted small secreted protein